jgi:hypothetical protein
MVRSKALCQIFVFQLVVGLLRMSYAGRRIWKTAHQKPLLRINWRG